MKTLVIAATAAAVAIPTFAASPALAGSRNQVQREQRECQRELRRADNRREYNKELRECRKEVNEARRDYRKDVRKDRRQAARNWRNYRNYDWNRREAGQSRYYADRYYRDGRYYQNRRLRYNDRVYRGSNGNYYCRRSDGTTGLIVGAGLGALLGNQLNIGGSTTLSTLIGGAAGAVIGREIQRGQLQCN
jgi:hypothetical protein